MAKKKKSVQAAQPASAEPLRSAQPVPPRQIPAKPWKRKDTISVVIFSLLLFLAMTVQTSRMSVFLAILAIVVSVGKVPLTNFRAHLTIPTVGLMVFALLNGISVLYSDFGSSAVSEFYKLTASFSLAVILLARFEKRHTRALLWGFGTVCAVIALLCIDLNGFGLLFSAFRALTEALGTSYQDVAELATGTRQGIYNDANLTGALLGMSSLVGLYLVSVAEKLRDKLLACLVLGFSTVGLLLCVSRGAYLSFGLAALVYLAVAGKGKRIPLFFRMLATAVATVIAGGVAMLTMAPGGVLSVLMAPVCGLLIFVLDRYVTGPLSAKLASHGKAFGITCGALVLAVVILAVAALSITGPHYFAEKSTLTRSSTLAPGSYTVSVDSGDTGELRLSITSHTKEESLMGKRTQLYSGPADQASFTVPEGATRVFFSIRGEAGQSVEQLLLSDGSKLPLSYRFLPETVAARLHEGLFTSVSYLRRVQFMADGLALFAKSPVIGHGLGASENLLSSVQPFYYESLYIHNHLIQIMDETGLLGLISFLALAGGSLWLLIRRLRREGDPLAAMLIAVFVMMNVHSLIEINFSVRMYQCAAFFLLLLPVLQDPKPLFTGKRAVRLGGWVLSAFVWLYLAVFGWLLISHRMTQVAAASLKADSAETFMNSMKAFASRDPMDSTAYKLNYIGNAVILEDPRYYDTMEQYVDDLADDFNYTTASGLARYYYLPLGMYEEMFACTRRGIAQEASGDEAWDMQLEFYRTVVLPVTGVEHMEEFLTGVSQLRDYLNEYNEGRMDPIKLSKDSQNFLDNVDRIAEEGLTPEMAFLLLYAAPET